MIDITTQVSGPQIARAMYGDEEETARFFGELADLSGGAKDVISLAQHVVDYSEAEKVSAFLRELADAIDAEAKA